MIWNWASSAARSFATVRGKAHSNGLSRTLRQPNHIEVVVDHRPNRLHDVMECGVRSRQVSGRVLHPSCLRMACVDDGVMVMDTARHTAGARNTRRVMMDCSPVEMRSMCCRSGGNAGLHTVTTAGVPSSGRFKWLCLPGSVFWHPQH